ncbi:MAG TPA: beta-ketoacyl synthase N-terminal-like domain-containing protein [Fibrobacteria bacterium]|nr:beta-ketoacyl synthase N-terminal-like domain-containing protein [Fibrobacteria bacterium]
MNAVRITGMGVVSSIGTDVPAFAASLRAGKAGFARGAARPDAVLPVAAEIGPLAFKEELSRRVELPEACRRAALRLGQRAPFPVQVSILAALEAWQAAALFGSRPGPERIALVVAGQNTTQNYQYGLVSKFRANPEYLSPRYGLEFLETNQVGILSELLGIRGEGFVTGGASATGNVGLVKGMQMIQAGAADLCLVAGVVADLSPMDIQGFQTMGAMGATAGKAFADRPELACRPFDSRHEGFIYGQAGACMVLESQASASRRGALHLATLRGGSIVLDGNASSDPNLDGEMRAMLAALERAGIAPAEVQYVNAHGSSSPLGDDTEAEAIGRVLGERTSEVWVNATKGLAGHCLYSAGVVEAVATVVQMRGGFLHPNRNLEDPVHKGLRFCGPEAVSADIRLALSNSFGFGGINTSLVLERGVRDGRRHG